MVSLLRSRQQSLALPVSLRFLVPFQARDAESESRFKKDFSECVKLISATAKRVAREAKEVERIEGKALHLKLEAFNPKLKLETIPPGAGVGDARDGPSNGRLCLFAEAHCDGDCVRPAAQLKIVFSSPGF